MEEFLLLPELERGERAQFIGGEVVQKALPSGWHGYVVRQGPDWACEISVSTLKKDVRDVRRTLELEQVPFYWVVDAASERLLVFELREGVLLQTKEFFKDDGFARLPPFDAVEFSLGVFLVMMKMKTDL